MSSDKLSLKVRIADRKDCPAIMDLRKELSKHSNMGNKPTLSYQDLERDGFDTNPPQFHCLVAEINSPLQPASLKPGKPLSNVKNGNDSHKVVGYALYFYGYAAWEGKVLHLEDLCASNSYRGKGIGTALLKQLAKVGVKENCSRIQLEVLDWNESALKFYNGHGGIDTTQAEGWHNFRFDREGIVRLANSKD